MVQLLGSIPLPGLWIPFRFFKQIADDRVFEIANARQNQNPEEALKEDHDQTTYEGD
jgi:hypothetical protein